MAIATTPITKTNTRLETFIAPPQTAHSTRRNCMSKGCTGTGEKSPKVERMQTGFLRSPRLFPHGRLHKRELRNHGTRKFTLLVSVPLGVTTWTGPVVAPAGTEVFMKVAD